MNLARNDAVDGIARRGDFRQVYGVVLGGVGEVNVPDVVEEVFRGRGGHGKDNPMCGQV